MNARSVLSGAGVRFGVRPFPVPRLAESMRRRLDLDHAKEMVPLHGDEVLAVAARRSGSVATQAIM